ncbi:SusD/RagB family nutrient-binding outer membrane lipoprotein [Myroides fluvii]|uniref:SusD/RagB family nutrient-binding outer membrane lipoprotein n=1 Tax=Myroides fluvii TaxID=2572594 RepID=UPI00131A7176|nr:SusD/RagB family nutrient-binding outer membrane lipoprotein [Myroides fluvii]
MKKYLKTLYAITLALTVVGCHDLDQLNEDPNKIKETDPYLLLTKVEKSAFSLQNIDKEYAARMIIQTDGESTYQYLKWGSKGFDRYKDLLQTQKMMDEATRTGKVEYLALGHFLKAHLFFELTMNFGDIPFSEALQGEGKIQFPQYDPQEAVFVGILEELEQASKTLKKEGTIQGDIIYKGDVNRWEKLIESYKLKVLITLSKKQKVGGIDVAQRFNEIYQKGILMMDNNDNGQLTFFDQAGSRYPQFNSSSYGSSMYMSGTFINLMKELKDPRLFAIAQRTASALEQGLAENDFSAYNGGDPIVPYAENEKLVQGKNISKVRSRYYQDPTNETNVILSYAELQFILAEAVARGWIAGNAEEFYLKGIKGNFDYYAQYAKGLGHYFTSEALEQYVQQPKVSYQGGNLSEQVKQILTQKYLIMFHQAGMSIYFDYLRTGFPELKIQQGITAPTRWQYPSSEYNRNQENLQKALDRQFSGSDHIRGISWWLK